jgi:hypothetical protein
MAERQPEPSQYARAIAERAQRASPEEAARLIDREFKRLSEAEAAKVAGRAAAQALPAGPGRRGQRPRPVPKSLRHGLTAINQYRRTLPTESAFDTLDHSRHADPCQLVLAALIVQAENNQSGMSAPSSFSRNQLRQPENIALQTEFQRSGDQTVAEWLARITRVRPTFGMILFSEAAWIRREVSRALLASPPPGLPAEWISVLTGLRRADWIARLRRCVFCQGLYIDASTPPTAKFCRPSHRTRMAEAEKAYRAAHPAT